MSSFGKKKFEKYPIDYLKAIDVGTLDEGQVALHQQLSEALAS
jgi:hypothetical protein